MGLWHRNQLGKNQNFMEENFSERDLSMAMVF